MYEFGVQLEDTAPQRSSRSKEMDTNGRRLESEHLRHLFHRCLPKFHQIEHDSLLLWKLSQELVQECWYFLGAQSFHGVGLCGLLNQAFPRRTVMTPLSPLSAPKQGSGRVSSDLVKPRRKLRLSAVLRQFFMQSDEDLLSDIIRVVGISRPDERPPIDLVVMTAHQVAESRRLARLSAAYETERLGVFQALLTQRYRGLGQYLHEMPHASRAFTGPSACWAAGHALRKAG